MPNPNYNVAAEVADLAARGVMTHSYARVRMLQLGIDPKVIESMMARAEALVPFYHKEKGLHELLLACGNLIEAWDSLAHKDENTLRTVADTLSPPLTVIRRLIGEPLP